MIPAVHNLTVDQGTRYERTLRFYANREKTTRTNLTGKTLKAQVRADWNKDLLIEIDVTVTNAAQGEALLVVDADSTKDRMPGKYQWDLLVTPTGGEPLKYIEGAFAIKGTITKPNA